MPRAQPSPCTRHTPDLSSLDGETAVCARCNQAIIGDGPYEVEVIKPAPGAAAHGWRVVRHRDAGNTPVALCVTADIATRIAALLNFAHDDGAA